MAKEKREWICPRCNAGASGRIFAELPVRPSCVKCGQRMRAGFRDATAAELRSGPAPVGAWLSLPAGGGLELEGPDVG